MRLQARQISRASAGSLWERADELVECVDRSLRERQRVAWGRRLAGPRAGCRDATTCRDGRPDAGAIAVGKSGLSPLAAKMPVRDQAHDLEHQCSTDQRRIAGLIEGRRYFHDVSTNQIKTAQST